MANEDSILVNGKKRLTVQIGIFTMLALIIGLGGFASGYALYYMDSRNGKLYVTQDSYAKDLQIASELKKAEALIHEKEMQDWREHFTAFEKTQDEMRGDIKQLLQIPRQVENLEKRIRYANSVDHPKEYPGGAIADPQTP